ncbi:MAG: glycoside hydrolase family 2 TIM barrel-domain containing protein [Kiritimatiellia bacterium]|jgi:hypothetical protein
MRNASFLLPWILPLPFAFFPTESGALPAGAPDDKGFLLDWLVAGPFPNEQQEDGTGKGIRADLLVPFGGESDALPRPGQATRATFVADKAKLIAGVGAVNEWGWKETREIDVAWKPHAFANGVIYFDGFFTPVEEWFVAYACCYIDAPKACDVVVAVGSDDDNRVFLNGRVIGERFSSQGVIPGNFLYDARLAEGLNVLLVKIGNRRGGGGFCVQLLDKDGAPVPGLAVSADPGDEAIAALGARLHPPRPIDALREENVALAREIGTLRNATIPALEARVAALAQQREDAKAARAAAYAAREAIYARERAAAVAAAPRSLDEPLAVPPAPLRSRLCLNGVWEVSKDRATWHPASVPGIQSSPYFVGWHVPAKASVPGDPHSAKFPDPAYGETSFHACITEPRAFYRTRFDWDGRGTAEFVSEGIVGRAVVRVNGTVCGAYDGICGEVRVPLAAGLVDGANELEVEWSRQDWGEHSCEGLRGSVYIDYVPSGVRVAGVWARPSWRRAALDAEIDLTNAAPSAVEVEVRASVVEAGDRVRLRLPPVRATLAPGSAATLRTASGWADPKVWGIGGAYGSPDLYELVTDLYADGRLVDRHRESFGFREFWIFQTDFFLNGRHIHLQGDTTGQDRLDMQSRFREIYWPLIRADGINIVRISSPNVDAKSLEDADRMGMLVYAQMYPRIHDATETTPYEENFLPFEQWEGTAAHAWNLANYRRWHLRIRNHPSVVVLSTDNEILTQAWDTADKAEFNVRNDRIGALYEKFVKSLDPTRVLTRDGDVGTHSPSARWFEEPPCDTANYHYPDFDVAQLVRNWPELYAWRPALFGETLYCSYGAWDNFIGAVPEQVEKKARIVRAVIPVYIDESVPGFITMGLGLDGFIQADETGLGNPWGYKRSELKEHRWSAVAWPSLSGRGEKPLHVRTDNDQYGCDMINWFDPDHPSHVRNAVNDAYRDTLRPQPALREGGAAEAVVEGAAPGTDVWSISASGERTGVRADRDGRAWFDFPRPGTYRFNTRAGSASAELPPRLKATPGFADVPRIRLGN